MSKIDEAKAVEAANKDALSALKRARCSGPGDLALYQFRARADHAAPWAEIRAEIQTETYWQGADANTRDRFARALQASLEACRVQIIEAAIQSIEAENRAAYKAAADEARAVLSKYEGRQK